MKFQKTCSNTTSTLDQQHQQLEGEQHEVSTALSRTKSSVMFQHGGKHNNNQPAQHEASQFSCIDMHHQDEEYINNNHMCELSDNSLNNHSQLKQEQPPHVLQVNESCTSTTSTHEKAKDMNNHYQQQHLNMNSEFRLHAPCSHQHHNHPNQHQSTMIITPSSSRPVTFNNNHMNGNRNADNSNNHGSPSSINSNVNFVDETTKVQLRIKKKLNNKRSKLRKLLANDQFLENYFEYDRNSVSGEHQLKRYKLLDDTNKIVTTAEVIPSLSTIDSNVTISETMSSSSSGGLVYENTEEENAEKDRDGLPDNSNDENGGENTLTLLTLLKMLTKDKPKENEK